MAGDLAFLSPLQDGAVFDFQVERGFGCGEPLAFQLKTPFSDVSSHPM